MLKYNIPPYDEQLHEGVIRHIVTRTAVFTKEIMVCIVIKGKTLPKSDFLVEELLKIKGVTSILLNYNNAKTNVIMGNKIDTLYGKAFIEDYIGEFKFEISPFSFFQVNPVQTQILYRTAFDFAGLTGTETVIDAYCGIGTISLFVSRKAKKVIGVEVVSEAVSDARRNALINGVSNVEFVVGKAEEVIPALWESHGVKPDVIFLDPPRKGCDARLIDTLLRSSTSKIVYVSCNPSTLARDLRLLSDKYSVVRVQPVDMFCMTAHVETIICLSRKK